MPAEPTHPTDTITAAGIARLAGVGRAAVSNWRRRHPDFPQPVGGTDTSPAFSLTEVETWLRNQGKLAEVPFCERLWQLVETDPEGPAAALARVGAHLLDPRPDTDPLTHAATTFAEQTTPKDTYEFLLRRHLDTSGRHLTLTPPETARLMAALAGPADTLLDPACGPGTLLIAAHHTHEHPPTTLYGQETDPGLARLTGLRLALHQPHHASAVHAGDSLLADAYPGLTADAVLCHPPFNQRNWGHDHLTYDPRWEYGLPARTESELAWVQHALAHLRPGGTAVLLMPPAAASRRTGRRIRAGLLRRGALRAVIALPPGAAPPHSLALHLWVLRKPTTTPAGTPRLLVIDTATHHRPNPRGTLDWPTLHRAVLDTWTAFDTHGRLPDQPGHHRALPVIDLLDDEVDLAPARHLPPPTTPTDPHTLTTVHLDLTRTLDRTRHLAPTPPTDPNPNPNWATTTLAELARAGALDIHLPTSTGPLPPTQPGDVLVPLVHDTDTTPLTHVVDHTTPPPTPPERHTALLRPHPDALDPWFLAGFLRASHTTRQASSYTSSATRIDIRRLKIPRLPLATQQRYGRRFAELAAFETALKRAAELGHRLTQGTIDALAQGTLPPGD